MPIFETDLKVMHSGGASNDLPSASLGGDISAVEVSNSVHAVFGVISSQVANAGSMEYRCVYIKNNHASLHWYNAVVWISSNTPSNKTEVQIALGLSAVNGSETAVATATTAPAVTFSTPSSQVDGLLLGDIPPLGWKAVWINRAVIAGAAAYTNDGATLQFSGDTGS